MGSFALLSDGGRTAIPRHKTLRATMDWSHELLSEEERTLGKKFIGQKSIVNTDPSGDATFTFSPATKVPAGQTITATARSVNLDAANGDTSEFSAPKTVTLASGSALSPETTKLSGPSGVTKSPTAHFRFGSPDPEATFECSLDGGAYYPCSSPTNINQLSEGRHSFEVRAVNGGGADQSPTLWAWTVDTKQ